MPILDTRQSYVFSEHKLHQERLSPLRHALMPDRHAEHQAVMGPVP